jgi:hypothetical protein
VGQEALVLAAVVEDGLSTAVPSGENGGKTLADDHVVRSLDWKRATLRREAAAEVAFELSLPEGARPEKTRLVFFVQDEKTGQVLQATSRPLAASGVSAGPASASPARRRPL